LGREGQIVDYDFEVFKPAEKQETFRAAGFLCCGGVNLRKGSVVVNSISLVQSQEKRAQKFLPASWMKRMLNLESASRTQPCVCGWGKRGEKNLLNSRTVISTAEAQNLQRGSTERRVANS
jgi:hypothetical protein